MRAQFSVAVSRPVATGCSTIDLLLGGGFDREAVTQVYGPPAAGKTNLTLSAAVQVAATGGQALIIDTEGLSIDRLQQIARGTIERLELDSPVETLLSGIRIRDVHDFDEQEQAVRQAGELAPGMDLIVLDSATGHYRLERDDDDEGRALRSVTRQVTQLLSEARRHEVAVVITNQVFSDPTSESGRVRPLGGHTLSHWSSAIVRLERFRGGNRRATLEKHRSVAAGESTRFEVAATGIIGTSEEI